MAVRLMGAKPGAMSTKDVFYKGSLIGAIITAPSLVALLAVWYVANDLTTAVGAAAVVHVVFLVIAFKVSRRILTKKDPPQDS